MHTLDRVDNGRPEVSILWWTGGTVTGCEQYRLIAPLRWLEQNQGWAPFDYAIKAEKGGRWKRRMCGALLKGVRAVRGQQVAPVVAGVALPAVTGPSVGSLPETASLLRQRAVAVVHRVHQGLVFEPSPSASMFLVCRNLMPGFIRQALREARERRVPLIYETDDLLFAVPDDLPSARNHQALRPLLLECIRKADHITVPNQTLADEIASLNPSVSVLPSFIDIDLWGVDEVGPPSEGPVRIGYWGTPSHLPDLRRLTPAFRHLKQKYGRQIQFHFMGCHDPEILSLADVSTASFLGSYADYAAATRIERVDIAIAPLADNRFNRCKSPVKFFEYSTRGACGLYADLPPYQGVVRHGENGLLLGPELEAWVGALERLIEAPALRHRLASQAQADVLAHHTPDRHAWRWRELYREVCAGHPQRVSGSRPARYGQEV